MGSTPPPLTPHWVGRSIATSRLRPLEHQAYVEQGEAEGYNKHLFVHIANSVAYTDPLLEVNMLTGLEVERYRYAVIQSHSKKGI